MLATAVLYSFITMFSFGIVNAISKEMTMEFGALRATVLRNLFVVPLIGISLVLLHVPFIFNWRWIEIGSALAFISYFGFLCFMLALKHGKVGVVIPVASSSIIVSSIFGFVFLNDSFGMLKAVTVAMVFVGVVITSTNFKEWRKSALFSSKSGVPYALLCALIWGVSFPLFRFPSDHLGSLFYALIVEIVVLASSFTQTLAMPHFERAHSYDAFFKHPSLRMCAVIATAAVGTAFGTTFLNFAYQTGEVSVVSAIYGSSSIVALTASAVLYKEVLSRKQYVGAVLVVLGILLPIFFLR